MMCCSCLVFLRFLPKDVSLTTQLTPDITLNIPLLSSAMDTVTEAKLAVSMAEEGGMGIIHKNMSPEQQAAEVRKVKRYEGGIVANPITVTPDTTLGELIALTEEYHISGMPVVEGKKLVGIITSRDIRFETDRSRLVVRIDDSQTTFDYRSRRLQPRRSVAGFPPASC